MAGQTVSAGYTLIELILVLLVLAICLVGVVPVFNQTLSSAPGLSDQQVAGLLVQERLDQILANRRNRPGFAEIVESNYGDEPALDLGGPTVFSRTVAIQGGHFDAATATLSCSGVAYDGETYKCVLVQVSQAETGRVLARRRLFLAPEGTL
ncbi:MAG: prepilin-type N-terminal cleavage/methylation domain-containing protein [Magnetococcales bacterium]|nr:prepilin-type N-terminal cleavage/methylation domain-containing protein [Magnetococcales bacterium]